ncbi:MAG: beta-ketoacyl synthase N-terminal-like domain-containing protein [Planctomycetota bacterium]|nr:beta-ketoacyl synthase N-terminal-like domain-containing protein [Planctomycetota bacterium]
MKPIAVIGFGLRFPESSDAASFWDVIHTGRDTSRTVPEDRWTLSLKQALGGAEISPDQVRSERGCFVDPPVGDVGDLDAVLAETVDPSVRLAVIAGVEAAKLYRDQLDPDRTRVILGQLLLPTESSSAVAEAVIGDTIEEMVLDSLALDDRRPRGVPCSHPLDRHGSSLPAAALQRALKIRGGAITLDAACASSLYALSIACRDLSAGRCDAALAGGVSRPDCLFTQMGFSQLRALSPEGRCRPLDHRGQGLLVGEGAGVLLLKRLDDAIAEGCPVLGVIRGAGLSNDMSGGLLAPSGEGQLRAMRAAYQSAGWTPSAVDYIECHATGTPVGDATELRSLLELWRDDDWRPGQCALGSVKACIGHTLTAAGAAGVIKVLLAMDRGLIPGLPDHDAPPDGIELESSPFRIPHRSEAWQRRSGTPRRAAVSAFGFGGINAHLLLEEAPSPQPRIPIASSSISSSRLTPPPAIQTRSARNSRTSRGRIAILGLGAIAGRHLGVEQVAPALLGLPCSKSALPMPEDLGIPTTLWARERGLDFPVGESCGRLSASPVDLRIPPTELVEMLPQQLALLKVAREALAGSGLDSLGERGGLFVGLGIDPRSSLYHLRWMLPDRAQHWLEELGIDAAAEDVSRWISELKDVASPPLDANRVMGALGSIAASRVARDLQAGGPCHTVSAEQISGFRAMEMAVRSLQDQEIDIALAAAADLGLDILTRFHDAVDQQPARADAAAAVLLKRLEDVNASDGPMIATIDGIGVASAGVLCRQDADSPARELARYSALHESAIDEQSIDLTCSDEHHSSAETIAGHPGWQVTLPSGLSAGGCSSFLLSLIQGTCAASRGVLPGVAGCSALPWTASGDDRRRVLIEGSGWLGDTAAMVISTEQVSPTVTVEAVPRPSCVGEPGWGIIALEGDDHRVIQSQARIVVSQYCGRPESAASLSREWLVQHPRNESAARAVTILFQNGAALSDAVANLVEFLAGVAIERKGPGWELHRSSETPLGYCGDVTFLYPGSGSLFPGAGRQLLTRYPGALDRTALTSCDLSRWLGSPESWQSDAKLPSDPRDAILAQVTLGCLGTDLLLGCGIDPERAAGHSLGETTMMFALRAWRDRNSMQRQMEDDDLFTHWLAGEHRAAAREWALPAGSHAPWIAAVVNQPHSEVREAISQLPRLYLLIVNGERETVIGGDPAVLSSLCTSRGWTAVGLDGVTSVHCPLVSQVGRRYHALHHWPVHPPIGGVMLHSTATAEPLVLTSDGIADSIMQQATEGFDFTKLVHSLWQAGSRIFIEPGPGASCSRLTHKILGDLPHRTLPLFWRGEDEELSLGRIIAACIAERVPADLEPYLGSETSTEDTSMALTIQDGGTAMKAPPIPSSRTSPLESFKQYSAPKIQTPSPAPTTQAVAAKDIPSAVSPTSLIERLKLARESRRVLSEEFKTSGHADAMVETILRTPPSIEIEAVALDTPETIPALFDRSLCLEFARGLVGPVLGAKHAIADQFPTRVRLPDEPLMLVDRILEMEGQPLTLGPGRIVTAHDILEDCWYLDGGRIPTSIAVESGQADLFLSAYLGADLHTRGLSAYRLLDAQVIFHDDLPAPGNTIIYDIHIDEFFRQDKTLLFRFHFEGTVDGKPLISMRDGCAGFFSQEELAKGRGIVKAPHRPRPQPVAPDGWSPPAGTKTIDLDRSKIDALRRGDLATAFDDRFAALGLHSPNRLPGGRMRLLDQVSLIEPTGGDWGLGRAVAELEIHPDDWFLTCHFSDDPVMPGTLMYECCLHTLRTLLTAWGWVGEHDQVIPMPVPGIAGRLRCRGQVLPGTHQVSYEVQVKEIGFRPEPYVITDATMYADGRPIVEMEGMSLRLTGLNRQRIEAMWSRSESSQRITAVAVEEPLLPIDAKGGGGDSPIIGSSAATLYDHQQILEFASGRPSVAFGDRYLPFDEDRFIARLPAPPYCFLDRIIGVEGPPWVVSPGAACTAEYLAVPDAWYFDAGGTDEMPFAVLIEIALQPCGWLAAYIGSALTSDHPMQFRNLGGEATQLRPLGRDIGLLTTEVRLTTADFAAGMWIQHFDLEVRDSNGPVYRGNTYFGFFPAEALAQQVGLPGAVGRTIPPREAMRGRSFEVPHYSDGPDCRFRMIDDVELFVPDGGTAGQGFIRGGIDVDQDAWFFRAHFQGDPVWPGSLGLESMLQLLQVVARDRWGSTEQWRPRTLAPGIPHRWTYRGQVIPDRKRVIVEVNIKSIDDQRGLILADGLLLVDDLPIYSMEDFSIERRELDR